MVTELSWLADENIHIEVVSYLREYGLDVEYVPELNLRGASDEQLMERAFAAGQAIITHDSDFGSLAFTKGAAFHSILYVRPGHFDPNFTT
jgi:predicted nuclease of predicted toxin-antitoxin system